MNFNSVEEILAFAIEKEEEAVEFYSEIAENESLQGVKQTFVDFANEEKKHVKMLQDMDSNKEKIATYEFKWIPDMKRSNYMVDITYEKGMHYTEILRLAMKREEKSLQLYNELASKADQSEFVNLFKILSQEEAKHKNILETIYDDFMAEQGD
jgi:rubrerythrin